MKAIRYHEYGPSSVLRLEDAPMPEIACDEVLVKVHAAGVNPADWKFRAGWFKDFVALPMPYTGGRDISGTVVRHGPLATRFAPGARIIAMADVMRSGAFAEYAVLRGDEIATAPATVTLEHAAGIPLAALTAWMALFDEARLTAGQSILIHAAAGGVGSFAVQFAKLAGAHVIATSSGSNVELVKSLGADEVIDYRSVDFTRVVEDLDVAIDPFGGEIQEPTVKVLRHGGLLLCLMPPGADPALTDRYGVRSSLVGVQESGARLAEIAALIDTGKVILLIDSEYPLADAAAAQDHSEAGHARGKIILRVE